jgi:hypothetical protein
MDSEVSTPEGAEDPDSSATTEAGRSPARSRLEALWHLFDDPTQPGWPPTWLRVTIFVAIFVLIIIFVTLVVSLIGWLFNGPVSAFVGNTAEYLASAMRSYLYTHAESTPLTGSQLWYGWMSVGSLLLILSWARMTGPRVGWIVFGLSSSAATWASLDREARWLGAAMALICWSLLSIAAFRRRSVRSTYRSGRVGRLERLMKAFAPSHEVVGPGPSSRGSRAAEARGAAMQRAAETKIRELGFDDMPAYLAARSSASFQRMAGELGTSSNFARDLREHFYPARPGERGTPYPLKRKAVDEYKQGETPLKEVAGKYGVAPSTLSRWLKELDTDSDYA